MDGGFFSGLKTIATIQEQENMGKTWICMDPDNNSDQFVPRLGLRIVLTNWYIISRLAKCNHNVFIIRCVFRPEATNQELCRHQIILFPPTL